MFKIFDGRDAFYQWDLNRKLIVEDDTISQVHFCNKTSDCSLVSEVKDGLADVPNILLQKDFRITVYGYDVNYTKHCETFDVIKRSKPEDYVYTEEELKEWDDLENRIEALEEGASIIEPAYDDIPKVFLGGDLPQTKDDTIMSFNYISKTENIKGYCITKAQGSSSMSFPKKNQTIKLYKDENCENKLKLNFKGWGAQNKYCLKANFIDSSHSRNIVSARLWSDVCDTRDNLIDNIDNSPNNGAIDGFPIKLYANGIYQGIYTCNIPKDAWLLNLDEDNPNHILLCGEENNNGEEVDTPTNFRALWNNSNAWSWKVEVGERTDAVVDSFNNLISCVKDTDDATFKSTIGNYLDINSAIDYWIFQYVICGLDGLAKNLLMVSYDGIKWICSAYDLDSTFGLYIDGSKFVSCEYRCPEDYQENRSLLWERISTLFADEIKARYTELRDKVFNYPHLFNRFERFIDVINPNLYEEDKEIYPEIPNTTKNNIKQIRAFIKDRLYYTDVKFGLIVEPEPEKTIIATNYIQSTDSGQYTLYDGAVDWNNQSLVMELALEPNGVGGKIFYMGENLNNHDDDILIEVNYWNENPSLNIHTQSSNVNGSWAQSAIYDLHNFITDWNNVKIEINKNGIFVNNNSINNNKTTDKEVFGVIYNRLMTKTTLQIGCKFTDETLHPLTFKSVYFYNI